MNSIQHHFRFYIIITILAFCLQIQRISARDEKFIKFYGFVKISNQICNTTSGIMSSGVCYSEKHCIRIGGQNAGSCANGYGTCCLVTIDECNLEPQIVKINGTHLLNPPNLPNPNICQYVFPRMKGVCQVRLDFDKCVIDNPEIFLRNCDTDTVTFEGASNTKYLGPICGNLTGQHVYLDYGLTSDIIMNIYTASNSGQQWDIKVTYIKCDSPDKAPDGCLQYFTEQSGIVTSFNFNNMLHENTEDYSCCFKPLPGMNKITWTTCGGFNDFVITGEPPIPSPPGSGLPPLTMPLSGNDCQTDWVTVYGVNKYCGNFFPPSVTSTTKPFLLQVHFDEQELEPPAACPGQPSNICPLDDKNAGFCLVWHQSP